MKTNRFSTAVALWLGTVVMMQVGFACAAGVKIGLIDTQRIIQESKAAKNARALFLKDLEVKRGVLKEKLEEVRAMQERLRAEGESMSPSTRKTGSERIEKQVKELRRLKGDLEEELKKKDRELTRQILLEIRKVVQAFLKQRGYTVIFEKKTVVAADEATDITDSIIRLYDTQD